MNYQSFLIKYSEIGLKGKNRYKFEDALVNNIRNSLREWGDTFKVYKEQERIYVDSNKDFYDIYDRVVEKLQKVFGISSISPNFSLAPNVLSSSLLISSKSSSKAVLAFS